ncbi:hypothetical protein NQ317_002023 [Molorchus minor]|uniref:Uncharacterized protein n=1 Tax=Molorchus minor TaxID=1323400 RepID=A0ABQ9JQV4_9CUCU|nr:hypothetical protein NQ317_002023 [Molorchus minor]
MGCSNRVQRQKFIPCMYFQNFIDGFGNIEEKPSSRCLIQRDIAPLENTGKGSRLEPIDQHQPLANVDIRNLFEH